MEKAENSNKWLQCNSSPALIGVGLRTDHFPYLESRPKTKIDWFEVITENHMNSKGRPLEFLEFIRKDYPVSFHGVSMSIASAEGLNFDYLERLKEMINIFDPMIVSDHLCWTGHAHSNLHNLLPFAYHEENLGFICERIEKVQEYLGRTLVLENLSAYFDYKESTMKEWEFISKMSKRSGCQVLLDINNVYVNSKNHNFDPKVYLDAIDSNSIAEFHLAGFTDMGDYLFDTHSKPVFHEVWDLYQYAIQKRADIPTLVEWDEDIPSFEVVENEAIKAREHWKAYYEQ